MYIYKITNHVNNKVYIGQSIRPVEQRFRRHMNDAKNHKLNTHFARAIRKYGEENFSIVVIDVAKSQEELNLKEAYWINYYNSIKCGYNETDALNKCGGNTYKEKTKQEMKKIREKISNSKLGNKNPNAKSVKCLNMNTGEELFFATVKECQEYFNEATHRFITTRITRQTKGLYLGIWNIAYAEDEYHCLQNVNKKGKQIIVTNMLTNETKICESINAASRMCNINKNRIKSKIKNNIFTIEHYQFITLN